MVSNEPLQHLQITNNEQPTKNNNNYQTYNEKKLQFYALTRSIFGYLIMLSFISWERIIQHWKKMNELQCSQWKLLLKTNLTLCKWFFASLFKCVHLVCSSGFLCRKFSLYRFGFYVQFLSESDWRKRKRKTENKQKNGEEKETERQRIDADTKTIHCNWVIFQPHSTNSNTFRVVCGVCNLLASRIRMVAGENRRKTDNMVPKKESEQVFTCRCINFLFQTMCAYRNSEKWRRVSVKKKRKNLWCASGSACRRIFQFNRVKNLWKNAKQTVFNAKKLVNYIGNSNIVQTFNDLLKWYLHWKEKVCVAAAAC